MKKETIKMNVPAKTIEAKFSNEGTGSKSTVRRPNTHLTDQPNQACKPTPPKAVINSFELLLFCIESAVVYMIRLKTVESSITLEL